MLFLVQMNRGGGKIVGGAHYTKLPHCRCSQRLSRSACRNVNVDDLGTTRICERMVQETVFRTVMSMP
jgi:hypothetical protein